MKTRAKRLALFAAIECGSPVWAREIESLGVDEVYDRILHSGYDSIKYSLVIEKVKSFESAATFQEIEKLGAHFIIPGMTIGLFALINLNHLRLG